MRPWSTIDQVAVAGECVLTRVDINVPLENGRVADNMRILRVVDTISDLRRRGAVTALISHLGRPKGRPDRALSLGQLVPAMQSAFNSPVRFCPATIGPEVRAMLQEAAPGDIYLLENLRFHPGETTNDPEFSARLAELASVYCNDAFSASHRAHASIVGVAGLLPSCAGRLLESELNSLEAALVNPVRPVVAIVGGSKISTKLGVLENLIARVDYLVIGGAMANTFLLADGLDVGRSLVEGDKIEAAQNVVRAASREDCELVLPDDLVVSEELRAGAPAWTVAADNCPGDRMILDIGPASTARILAILESCQTLVWNGPVGAFETPPFDGATNAIATGAARLTAQGSLVSVAGGGDTVAALNRTGSMAGFSYVSMAGGAFLEWMEGKTLPGIRALSS